MDTGGLQLEGQGFALDLVLVTHALEIDKANVLLSNFPHLLQCLPKLSLLVDV